LICLLDLFVIDALRKCQKRVRGIFENIVKYVRKGGEKLSMKYWQTPAGRKCFRRT